MHVRKSPDRQRRWERATELPLLIASPLFLACYAVWVLAQGVDLLWRDVVIGLALLIWALFAVDYAVRLALSGEGVRFVRTHWLDTVVLLLPLLRPLRIVNTYLVVQHRRGRPGSACTAG